jgi:NADH-quinone oxidoreductase subunit J
MLQAVFFYVFSAILILSAFQVILAKNPIHSVLFLVLAFVTSSCLWIMLNVEFLALTLILVYVGAVMVLFLFVVMMLDIDIETMRKGFWKNLPLAIVLAVVMY